MTDSTGREDLTRRWNDCARLASRIAHDFDNVLTGVNGFVDLALNDITGNNSAGQHMREILRATGRGAEFTSQLHLLQRCGIYRPKPTEVGPILIRLERSTRPTLPQRVALQVRVAPDLPRVDMDDEPLFSAVNQLLTNAVEACGEQGTVSLEAGPIKLDVEGTSRLFGNARPGFFVEIRIADCGPGISPEVRSQLLIEPLYTTKLRHRGLGLAIAFRALSAHGGGFSLEPGAVKGTVGRVCVPVA